MEIDIAHKTGSSSKRPFIIALLVAAATMLVVAGVSIPKKLTTDKPGKLLAFFSGIAGRGNTENTTGDKRLPIETALYKKFTELECRTSDITSHYSVENRTIVIQAAVPRGRPFEAVVLMLSQCVRGTTYIVSDCTLNEQKQTADILFSSPAKNSPRVSIRVCASPRFFSGTAKLAIVIENMEDTSLAVCTSFLAYNEPLTVSIMPGSKRAGEVAQLAGQHRKEVIVRIPLEPQTRIPAGYEQSTIMVHYPENVIRKIFSDAVKKIPNAAGFTNAWKSRACEDSRIMNIVLADVRKQHGYFIETGAARNSVTASIAARLDLPFFEAGVLVEKKTVSEITADLRRQGESAQVNGSAVVCVSACRQLADALTEIRPWFRQNGIRLVSVSEMVKHLHD